MEQGKLGPVSSELSPPGHSFIFSIGLSLSGMPFDSLHCLLPYTASCPMLPLTQRFFCSHWIQSLGLDTLCGICLHFLHHTGKQSVDQD